MNSKCMILYRHIIVNNDYTIYIYKSVFYRLLGGANSKLCIFVNFIKRVDFSEKRLKYILALKESEC